MLLHYFVNSHVEANAVLEHKVLEGEPLPGPYFISDTDTQMSWECSAHMTSALQAKKNISLKK